MYKMNYILNNDQFPKHSNKFSSWVIFVNVFHQKLSSNSFICLFIDLCRMRTNLYHYKSTKGLSFMHCILYLYTKVLLGISIPILFHILGLKNLLVTLIQILSFRKCWVMELNMRLKYVELVSNKFLKSFYIFIFYFIQIQKVKMRPRMEEQ